MELLTTILGGGVTGLLGNIFTSIFSYKQIKEKNAHDRAMAKISIDATVKEAEANIRITEATVAGKIQESEMEAFTESIKQSFVPAISNEAIMKLFEKKYSSWIGVVIVALLGFVEALKQFVRPGLTTYLVVILSIITYQAYQISGRQLLSSESKELLLYMLDAIIYMVTTAFTWWFADRRNAKNLNRLNGWKK